MITSESTIKLIAEIKEMARQRNAVILAHNYQLPEIQDLADFVGDSLGLSQQAAQTDADVIVFCGVHFMAETAAILSPQKRVLLPDLEAGCSLAASIDLEQLREWKAEHPGAVVVSYVNTTADIKAESDYCCTSGNALKIVQSIDEDKEILFLPDQFLGSWVQKMTGRKNMRIWMGECHVHAAIHPSKIDEKLQERPDAELLIHPECGCLTPYLDRVSRAANFNSRGGGNENGQIGGNGNGHGNYGQTADNGKNNGHADNCSDCLSQLKVTSTEGMIRRASESTASEFVVATEIGILHRLQKENPNKTFHAIDNEMSCRFMKMITLEKVHKSLRDDVFHVTVSDDVAGRARLAIDRMISIY